MNNYILELVKSIGLDYKSITSKGLISSIIPAIDDSSAFYAIHPKPGLELLFSTFDNKLERILITKKDFNGELPRPIEGLRNKDEVLMQFGKPTKSTGYKKLPLDFGEIGGTDMYYLSKTNRNAEVTFSYSTALEIIAITFDATH